MLNIRNELSLRDNEVKSMILFLVYMENRFNEAQMRIDEVLINSPDINPDIRYNGDIMVVRTSIKASVVLMLYNAVESTVTKCLERIHEILSGKNLTFDACNHKLKELITAYYENAKEKSPDVSKKVPYILEFYEYIIQNCNFKLSYTELSKFYSLYSGNLDSKKITNIMNRYGIEFHEKATELKTIKDNRNSLAHGEQTFEEIGRDLNIDRLRKMSEKTFEYMRKMIDITEKYVNDEAYKA